MTVTLFDEEVGREMVGGSVKFEISAILSGTSASTDERMTDDRNEKRESRVWIVQIHGKRIARKLRWSPGFQLVAPLLRQQPFHQHHRQCSPVRIEALARMAMIPPEKPLLFPALSAIHDVILKSLSILCPDWKELRIGPHRSSLPLPQCLRFPHLVLCLARNQVQLMFLLHLHRPHRLQEGPRKTM